MSGGISLGCDVVVSTGLDVYVDAWLHMCDSQR